ncbi:protein trichome birefringence-like 1 [Impatiens glandulifera]|uniref:protein trichome birefringence-like 1 n=1 Tax=Impatiens glandulifera TaxID=253017 RepID=UPI001FB050CF|nr:protein trichome birefringence-like 1 [Impatiens glandulifera]
MTKPPPLLSPGRSRPPAPSPTTEKHFSSLRGINPIIELTNKLFSPTFSSSLRIRSSIVFAYGFGLCFAIVLCILLFVFNTYHSPLLLKPRSHKLSSLQSPIATEESHHPTLPFSLNNEKLYSMKMGAPSAFSNEIFNNPIADEKENGKNGEIRLDLMKKCNMYNGNWVRDDDDDLYPLYPAGSCPYIDEQFNCYLNGRRDNGYEKLRWQPNGCNIPRLNGKKMLKLLKGKRLVYVGDSLNRNMWESMVCILRNSVEDKSKVFEASGRNEFRSEGWYSFVFADYNCSVEFFKSTFLVQEWESKGIDGSKKLTLRLDILERSSDSYRGADILVFNTGHWWTRRRTSRGKGYFQEGSIVYNKLNIRTAFAKAMKTWTNWVDTNVDPTKSTVFFRGYSPAHFRGGKWDSGGKCDKETEPIKNESSLSEYPLKMRILEQVIEQMKTPIVYLNISTMTDYRKDAHPSIYRKSNVSTTAEEIRLSMINQDCSHWCLPGVPDVWNELIYAHLLIKHYDS